MNEQQIDTAELTSNQTYNVSIDVGKLINDLKDKTFENDLLKTRVDELEKKSYELEFEDNQKARLIKYFTDSESPKYYRVDRDGEVLPKIGLRYFNNSIEKFNLEEYSKYINMLLLNYINEHESEKRKTEFIGYISRLAISMMDYEKLKVDNLKLNQSIAKFKGDLDAANTNVVQLKHEKQSLQLANDRLNKEIEEHKKTITDLKEKENHQHVIQISDLNNKLKKAEEKIAKLSGDKKPSWISKLFGG